MPSAPDTFFLWFFFGLSGLGGWFIFFLLSLAAVIWLFYDSAKRKLPALTWRLVIALTASLILPTIFYSFTTTRDGINLSPLRNFSELIFGLGILGGVLPGMLAIRYYFFYRGMIVCSQGHVYEAKLGKCPNPEHLVKIVIEKHEPPEKDAVEDESAPPLIPVKKRKHVHAWLVAKNGKDYQLLANETRIGRSLTNDIVLEHDKTVNRESAKILEQNGHFRLYSLTTQRYPRMNGRFVHEPILLEHDDEIEFGDRTVLRFIKSRY
ncbi:MAG: FHA domain-containing protein [Chloroflexi bacterium]|nr:FHA domain-containing protein [Chloroflexota bacterium]